MYIKRIFWIIRNMRKWKASIKFKIYSQYIMRKQPSQPSQRFQNIKWEKNTLNHFEFLFHNI